VQADFDTPNLTLKRREPIRYFGWMKMRLWSLYGLCEELAMFQLAEIAPWTTGGARLVICEYVAWAQERERLIVE
jgi:hypothetical protein